MTKFTLEVLKNPKERKEVWHIKCRQEGHQKHECPEHQNKNCDICHINSYGTNECVHNTKNQHGRIYMEKEEASAFGWKENGN